MSEDFVYMCWEIMEGLYIRDYSRLDNSIEKKHKNYFQIQELVQQVLF